MVACFISISAIGISKFKKSPKTKDIEFEDWETKTGTEKKKSRKKEEKTKTLKDKIEKETSYRDKRQMDDFESYTLEMEQQPEKEIKKIDTKPIIERIQRLITKQKRFKRRIKAKGKRSEEDSDDESEEIEDFTHELDQEPPKSPSTQDEEVEESPKPSYKEAIGEYEEYRLKMKQKEESDVELINKVGNHINKAVQLINESQFDEAYDILNKTLEKTGDIYNSDIKEELIVIIRQLIEKAGSASNQD
jgi:hypothetical protein